VVFPDNLNSPDFKCYNSYLHVVNYGEFCLTDMNMYLVFPAFTPRTTSFLVAGKDSLFSL
jgi:hypothetical protein